MNIILFIIGYVIYCLVLFAMLKVGNKADDKAAELYRKQMKRERCDDNLWKWDWEE